MFADCFGAERLVSLCLVYAMSPQVLVQAPGGRANARVVPKAYFELLSLRHGDGHFYLRPDRILCSMLIDERVAVGTAQEKARAALEQEAARDIAVQQQLAAWLSDSVRRAEFLQQEFHRAESQVASPEAESTANDRPVPWGIWGAMLGAADSNPAHAPGRFPFPDNPQCALAWGTRRRRRVPKGAGGPTSSDPLRCLRMGPEPPPGRPVDVERTRQARDGSLITAWR